jgi:general secretion pathway protein G
LINFNAWRIKLKNINKAFSLIETLIWVGIVGIFVGLVGIAGISFWDRAKVKAAIQEMKIYSTALLDYYDTEKKYPSNEEGLKILLEKKYVTKTKFLDPWGTPYNYIEADGGFLISSYGSDKKEGGEGTKKDLVITEGDANEIANEAGN